MDYSLRLKLRVLIVPGTLKYYVHFQRNLDLPAPSIVCIRASTLIFVRAVPTPSLVASILSPTGGGCVGLRVEPQGQRVGLLGTGAG